jgi:hypothetical protein
MNKSRWRLLLNRILIVLAILAILAGLLFFDQWRTVLINARLL